MNTHFGQWNFHPSDQNHKWFDKITSLFSGDAPEQLRVFSSSVVSIVYRDLDSAQGNGSAKLSDGSTIFWNGRLDNAQELRRALGGDLPSETSDARTAAEAFARWRTDAFPRMIGDWSFVAWNPNEMSLVLAKDPIGTRPLFYQLTPNNLRWGTALEWLVQAADSTLQLNLEYLAGWLSFFPDAHLTPYESIQSVPPSSFVRFTPRGQQVLKYWEFPEEEIQHLRDDEYDEHFRTLLAQSVRRRLRATGPVLAELSGGMDSSAIVCLADVIASIGQAAASRLDTVSYFDDSEPNWNERPYFAKVEEKRGRAGFHIALDFAEDLEALFRVETLASTPAECARNSPRNQAIKELAEANGYVGVLSGIGGDEFTGGVPTAQPELADLLMEGRLFFLAGRLKAWGVSQRRPWTHLLFDTVSGFLPLRWTRAVQAPRPASWLDEKFVHRYRHALNGYSRRLQVFGGRPSFQENLSALGVIRRQLACSHTSSRIALDKRYPYLDRDLLAFLFTVPRQQLTQPGRRRALMRRALTGIVPDEILNRKRKAYVAKAPRVAISAHWDTAAVFGRNMVAESLGIVSGKLFEHALREVRAGSEVPVQAVLRTFALEKWLRNLVKYGALPDSVCALRPLPANHQSSPAGMSPRISAS